MKAVLVFCGSNKGHNPRYEQAAYETGKMLAQRRMRIVYGAGNVGLMGIVAESALAHGGEVVGVIPHFLRDREVYHRGLTELIIVESMAERKLVMAQLSDAVITLPGGYGTMDELFEMLTLAQLSQAHHPIGIFNINGFFDPLIMQLDRMQEEHFLKPHHRSLLLASDNLENLLTQMAHYEPATAAKWF